MRHALLRATGLALAALLAGSPAPAAKKPPEKVLCDLDVVPAATLLIPHFRTDVSVPTGAAFTTLGAVTNTGLRNQVVHVTLWTDWAIPTMSFDWVLSPGDVQTFDVHNWFFTGLEVTQVPFSTCTGALAQSTVHLNPGIAAGATLAETLANVRHAHEGLPFPGPGGAQFVASSSHPGVAIGYLTLDAVNRCSDGFPSTPGYFKAGGKGIASNANVLAGDVFFLDNTNGHAEAEPAVHIRASSAFKKGDYTFYGRYTFPNASDNRQPLGNSYGSRYVVNIPIAPTAFPETDLIVWRDVKSLLASPVPAGTQPYWVTLITTPPITVYDEQEQSTTAAYNIGLATQAVPMDRGTGIATPYNFGWLKLSLNHAVPWRPGTTGSVFGPRAQGWVSTVYRARVAGAPAGGAFQAFRLSTVCPNR